MRKWNAGAAAFFMAALWIVSGCGGDSSTKTAALHSPMKVLTGHTAGVNAVAYSPDGSLLASGAASVNNSIRLWDSQTGEHLRTLEGRLNGVHSLAFSPDGKTLASGGDNSIRLWDPQTGDLKRTLNCGAQCSESLAFSPDGETLAVGIADGIQLWNAATGELNRTIQTDGAAVVEFSSDSKTAPPCRFGASKRAKRRAGRQRIEPAEKGCGSKRVQTRPYTLLPTRYGRIRRTA